MKPLHSGECGVQCLGHQRHRRTRVGAGGKLR
jgi:hypothetical protein